MAAGPVRAWAPGRVNLIGEHTDYNEGLAFPLAIELGTSVGFVPDDSPTLRVRSTLDPSGATINVRPPRLPGAIRDVEPGWAKLIAALVAELRPTSGGTAEITSTLPAHAGLSSSAALCVALALALAWVDAAPPNPRPPSTAVRSTGPRRSTGQLRTADPVALAELCSRAEGLCGSPVGLMDPLVSLVGRAGHGLLIDFSDVSWTPVPIPSHAELVVVHSGQERHLAESRYAERREECAAAARILGVPVGRARVSDLSAVSDPRLHRRARHAVTECGRVREFARALEAGDLEHGGSILTESHRSQAEDFDCSTPVMDELVAQLVAASGVYGARMTGGGFGGCAVAITEPGALDLHRWPGRAWRVTPSDGASVTRQA